MGSLGHERWLPEFDGELEVTVASGEGATLRLHGFYTVPMGHIGRFGDGVIGHRLARRALTRFLDDVAARLDREVRATEIKTA